MVTTIQINEHTLQILKRLKEQMKKSSYEETIMQLVKERGTGKSMAGSLKKYYKNKSLKEVLNELQHDRRESDRF